MELASASAATGSARLVLQVVTSQRAPAIEFYFEVRNQKGPLEEFEIRDFSGKNSTTHRYRPQNLFLHVYMVNVGGSRAEDVQLELSGDLDYFSGYKRLSRIGILSGQRLKQFAPAQMMTICNIDADDLQDRNAEGKVVGIRKESFSITARYDGPKVWLNWPGRLWAWIWRRQQYTSVFEFNTAWLEGVDLPPTEYV